MLALPTSVAWPFSSTPLLQSTVPENGTAPVVPLSCASSSRDWLPATAAGSIGAVSWSAVLGACGASAPRRSSVLLSPAGDGGAGGATVSVVVVGAEGSAAASAAVMR